jgi:RimJ/RimL family protein N-acetyltransferase
MITLENQPVLLRELCPEDAIPLAVLANNKKIFDNVRDFFPYPYTEKDAEDFIGYCQQENPVRTFAVIYEQSLAGVIGLVLQSDVYRKTAEIGYWIGEPFWNRGIATRAVNLMVGYAFDRLDLIRLHTGVFDYNKASQRVLEKCAFKLEGIFERSIIKNDKICDEYRYARLKKVSESIK